MSATIGLVSVEEYLQSTYEPRCEYVDGELIPKPMPTRDHAKLQWWLCSLIDRLYPKWEVTSELRLPIASKEFRLPDVAVEPMAHATSPYPEKPVFLCIEILSPEDRIGAMFAKCERYHDWGVPHCWIVDPMTRRAWSYPKGGEPREVSRLEAGEIVVELPEAFSILDRKPA